ncbi:MAG: hypothetical protein N4A41_05270 [Crocinitomicaceae bacterium]|jgi:hypothetical protein|nr:hypothetical protein [Crocinitomicaceae bacterium]
MKTKYILPIVVVLITSCGNYNRLNYQRFNHDKKSGEAKEFTSTTPNEVRENDQQPQMTLASNNADEMEILLETPSEELITNETLVEDTNAVKCDQLVLKNGEDKDVKVQLITEKSIRYKNCDHLDGPDYEQPLSEVLFVKYSNGKKEVFEVKEEPKVEAINIPARNRNSSGENNSITGFVMGLSSIFLFWTAVVPIIGLAFSWTGIIKGRHEGEVSRYEGLAIVGVILNALGIIGAIVLFFIYFL